MLPSKISASDHRSFAAYTLRNRLPHILRQIIEDGNYNAEVVHQLEGLGTDVLEGTITPLAETNDPMSAIWTQCLQTHLGQSWFTAPFFLVEMYFYRRIIDIIDYRTAADSEFHDPFIVKKRKGFADAQPRTQQLAEWLVTAPEGNNNLAALQDLFLVNLWSNCADLSQLPETFRPELGHAPSPCHSQSVFGERREGWGGGLPMRRSKADPPVADEHAPQTSKSGSEKLLINDVVEVSRFIVERSGPLHRIDIILDNTGIELISDLALADFLLRTNLAQQVVLHAKDYPVFVSDATPHDIQFTIREMATSDVPAVAQWGQRLEQWLGSQSLGLQQHPFWTLPLYFDAMLPDLQAEINTSDLWIVKGDANYRRLVGDRHWTLHTPIDTITAYLPTPCLALRVLKCELLVGMDLAKLEAFDLEDDWMTNGTYGIIQWCPDPKAITSKN